MKKIIITLVAVCLGSLGSAQPINKYVSDVVQPTPNAASLGKYGDVPVSNYTGIPSINIPIYSLSQGPLNHNVSLSYHAGGIRVEEMASRVGLGWTLQAGGSVSRIVNGTRDDQDDTFGKGYYYFGGDLDNLDPSDDLLIDQLREGARDGEPDLFSFNCGEYSGKFYINKNKQPVLVPLQDIKVEVIESGGQFEGFIIKTPEGNRHHFGKYNTTTAYDVTWSTTVSQEAFRSTWHLLRTESYDRTHHITFTYEADNYSYTSSATCRAIVTECSSESTGGSSFSESCSGGSFYLSGGDEFYYNTTNIIGKRLKRIISDNVVINFVSPSSNAYNRLDLGELTIGGSTNKRSLRRIDISTGSGSNSLCKRFFLSYNYFTDSSHLTDDASNPIPAARRLRLRSVQERSCDNTIIIPAHTFTYQGTTTMPWRHSKQRDHWGFYNGQFLNDKELVNIPETTITVPGSSALTFGSSERFVVEDKAKQGTLTRINYPTGGHTEFVYESNRHTITDLEENNIYSLTNCVTPTQQSCCGNPTVDIENRTFTASELSSNQSISMTLNLLHQGGLCGDPNAVIHLNIIRVDNNQMIFSDGFSFMPTSPPYSTTYDYALSPLLQADVEYEFRLEVTNGWGIINLFGSSPVRTDELVGGLRTKKITTHDGISANRNIIKDYTYISVNNESSGHLIYRPIYGQSIQGYTPIGGSAFALTTTVIFSTSSFVPTSSFEANHIGYSRVTVDYNGNGRSIFDYRIGQPEYNFAPQYPYQPIPIASTNGTEKSSQTFKQNDLSNSIASSNSSRAGLSFSGSSEGKMVRISEKIACAPPIGGDIVFFAEYNIPTNIFLYGQQSQTLDGVTTTTDYGYDALKRFYQPTTVSMTNSDDKIYSSHMLYPIQFDSDPVYQEMASNLNILTPITTTKRVGTNPAAHLNQLVDKTEVDYNNFTTAHGTFPYPAEYFRDEVTWNDDGTVNTLTKVSQAQITDYDDATGQPSEVIIDGWEPISYSWNTNGTLDEKTFESFTTSYDYHPNTTLLSQMTNVDGTSHSYTYDELQRIKTITDNCRTVTTTLDYLYGAPAVGGNYIRTTTDYPTVVNSDLDIITNRQYFDGLGRAIQTVSEDQGPTSNEDIVIATEYDSQGRVLHTYEAKAIDGNNGSFQSYASLDTIDRVVYSYEPSPLNRPTSMTHTGFDHPSTTTYGANASTYLGYPAFSLFKQTEIDGDNKQSISYTDKRGRIISTEQAGPGGVSPLVTSTSYDDKDRIMLIIPPGSTSAVSNLNFSYTYYGNDLVHKKKIPDQDEIEYRYNRRDLPISYQDGMQRALSRWINTHYDDYGRVTRTGYNATPGTNNQGTNPTVNTSNRLTQTNYYTTGNHVDKVRQHFSWILHPDGTLDPTDEIFSDYVYDGCGRPSTLRSTHLLNDNINQAMGHTYSYDGADNVILDDSYQHVYGLQHLIDNTQTIDFAGRPLITKHRFDNLGTKDIAQTTYNQWSLPATMRIGKTGSNWLETCIYGYLDNQWLSSMDGSLFDYNLHYDSSPQTTAAHQMNGNIAEIDWQVVGASKYHIGYEYDNYNRLETSVSKNVTNNISNQYNTGYGYDVRGNLTSISRSDQVPNTSNLVTQQIDQVTITPVNNSNQIKTVTDGATGTFKHRGVKSGSADFDYDDNGNMTYDATKGITIDYNYINKPIRVDFGDGRVLEWTYDADGNLLRKEVKIGNSILEDRYYIGDAEYKDGELVQVMHPQGRIAREDGCDQNQHIPGQLATEDTYHGDVIFSDASVVPVGATIFKAEQGIILNPDFTVESNKVYEAFIEACNPGPWMYNYILKDHLGNTRVVFTEDGDDAGTSPDILQEMHYYPFGMEMTGPWLNRERADYNYRYNGKEMHLDFGFSQLDYGARFYDPSIGRFTSVDPLFEEMSSWSPYNYTFNNPILFTDPTGMAPETVIPGSEDALNVIKQTLSEDDAKFVQLDADGNIDRDILNSRDSESGNFASLKTLVNDDTVYEVNITEQIEYKTETGEVKTVDLGEIYYTDFLSGEQLDSPDGWGGVTQTPGDKPQKYNSVDGVVRVGINSNLKKDDQARFFSHEGYGHAALFSKGINHVHQMKSSIAGFIETNIPLRNAIRDRTAETNIHINQRKNE